MDASFWKERWATGRIAFHEGRANTYLERHAAQLDGRSRVLVPMCGKAEDLAFLAGRGHAVVGVELVEDAVRAFFDEHSIAPTREQRGDHVVYRAGAITLIAGDVLATTAELVGPFDAIYDRGALVALPPEMRRRYAAHLLALSRAGTRILLVTFEYDQTLVEGPPFAVLPEEVPSLYGGTAIGAPTRSSSTEPTSIQRIDGGPDPRVREGFPPATESLYVIDIGR